MEQIIQQIIDAIHINKDTLSNPGTRPLVSEIQSKSRHLKEQIELASSSENGLIAIIAPDPVLISLYFKGWKVADFERLAIELELLV